MTDHNPLPRCPYCGEHMGLECNTKNMYWYECYKCGATTPQEGAEQAAYEAAMNRWQEPNRVLTLESVHITSEEMIICWKRRGCAERIRREPQSWLGGSRTSRA